MGRPAAKSRKVDAPPQTTLNGAKSNPDDNDSAPPKALTNTSSTQLGSRGAPTKQASSAPVQTEAKTLTLRKGANDNEYSYPLAEVDLYPDGPPSRPADAAVSPPGTVGDEESNGTTIPSGIEPPTAVPSSDEDDYRVKLDALFEVAVRESEVELREANVALRESEVKLREANVALRESEVELREQAVELRESELEHRQHDVD